MTPDEKALGAVRSGSFDSWDTSTQYAVNAFLAPFTDTDADTGVSFIDAKSATVAETGFLVMHPTAWGIMQRVGDPEDLTAREVLALVLTSDAPDTYSPTEWDLMVKQAREAANAREAAAKIAERKQKVRATRKVSSAPEFDPLPGYRAIPDADLKRASKERRKASLKAAIERREKRREAGVVIVPSVEAFDAMPMLEKVELRKRQKEFALSSDHMRELVADMLAGPDIDHVGFLYHHGRAPRLSNSHLATISAWTSGGER